MIQRHVFQRHIPLRGTVNFRDIGGYSTQNKKTFRPGMIYRSAHLAKLKRADINLVDQLGLRLILDLRNPQEIAHSPSRLPPPAPPVINLAMHNPALDHDQLYRDLLSGKLNQFDFEDFFKQEYRRYVTDCDDEIRKLFSILLQEDNYPVLIHCTGGKDRTGILVALIHLALGVPAATVYSDYLLSQETMRSYIKTLRFKLKLMSLFRLQTHKIWPLLETHAMFLQEALDTINSLHGSTSNYLTHLGMDNTQRHMLQTLLCE
ncbi:MAG: tyrosine-protein phosphatase [Gammaproteobacteria bacterium]|nr:tyrosine-protein phosphatase [Gammaproteobacteria bacterium]MDH5801426.1 tyrosine-protein phosphatase [Gammaproteobacteria bacterium]